MRGVFEFVVRRKPQVPAIRKLVSVARDSKLLDPIDAARIVTVLGRAADSSSVAHGWPIPGEANHSGCSRLWKPDLQAGSRVPKRAKTQIPRAAPSRFSEVKAPDLRQGHQCLRENWR